MSSGRDFGPDIANPQPFFTLTEPVTISPVTGRTYPELTWTAVVVGWILGVIVIKRESGVAAKSEQVLSENRAELNESLANIISTLERMNDAGDSISTTDLRAEIDDHLRMELMRFADARESLIHLFGLQAYANVMSDFAAGERYVNRVWSASADGYDGEARSYLGRAAVQFRAARQRLDSAAAS